MQEKTMKHINVIDEAQLRQEFRRLYKEVGFKGMLQVVYELCISVQICIEVIKEEYSNEKA